MQPYVFPYIGYFSLINFVHHFVFYDDVQFIKKSWLHRNKILINNKEFLFSIPLTKSSQKDLIFQKELNNFNLFREEFLKKIERSYSNAPYFLNGMNYINEVLDYKTNKISELAIYSINVACKLLNIKTNKSIASKDFSTNRKLNKSDRLISISKKLGVSIYINSIGGINLYDPEYFKLHGVSLSFLKVNLLKYKQFNSDPISGLSIIDYLMFLSIEEIKNHLNNIEIVNSLPTKN